MTAPNKMAKRAAAGTLALAICFTGGVLGAGAANAETPPLTAASVASVNNPGTGDVLPFVAEDPDDANDAQPVNSIEIDLGTTAFTTDDRLVVQLPTGFTFNPDTLSLTAVTGPNVANISNQFTVAPLDGSNGRAVTITPNANREDIDAIADNQTVSLTLGIREADNAATPGALGQLGTEITVNPPASTSLANLAVTITRQVAGATAGEFVTAAGPGATFSVDVASLTEAPTLAFAGPATSMVTPGSGAQTVGPYRISEVTNTDDLVGDYVIDFVDANGTVVNVDTGASSSALRPRVTTGSTGYTGTAAPQVDGKGFAVTIGGAGNPAGAPESVQVTNLRINPQDGLVGPITARITPAGGDLLEAAQEIIVQTINDRLAGTDRYGTAAQVARKTANLGAENFPSLADGVDKVVLVNSGYGQKNGQAIDALTANYVAGGQARAGVEVPILLSGADSIPAVTTDAIRYVFGSFVTDGTNNYANKTITIVGGEAAVSNDVVKQLRDFLPGVRIDRIAGDDRYATAANAVTQTATSAGAGPIVTYTTDVGQPALRTAVIASGEEAVDALSAGPYSYSANLPLLLSRQDSLPIESENALRQLGIKNVLLLGGPNAVSAGVETKLKDLGITVNRINGADRYETSTQFQTFIASPMKSAAQPGYNGLAFKNRLNQYFGNADEAFLANGVTFADALVAGPLAGSLGEPLVLSEAATLNDFSKNFITAGAVAEIFPIGGVQVLNESVVTAAKAAADGGDGIDGLPDNGASPFGDPNAAAPITGLAVAGGPAAGGLNVTFQPFAPGSFNDVSSITYSLRSTTTANVPDNNIDGQITGATNRNNAVDAEQFTIPGTTPSTTGATPATNTIAPDTYNVTVTIVADGKTYTSSTTATVS